MRQESELHLGNSISSLKVVPNGYEIYFQGNFYRAKPIKKGRLKPRKVSNEISFAVSNKLLLFTIV